MALLTLDELGRLLLKFLLLLLSYENENNIQLIIRFKHTSFRHARTLAPPMCSLRKFSNGPINWSLARSNWRRNETQFLFEFPSRMSNVQLPSDPVRLRWRWWGDRILWAIRRWRSRHRFGCCRCIRTGSSSNLWPNCAAPLTTLLPRNTEKELETRTLITLLFKPIFRSPHLISFPKNLHLQWPHVRPCVADRISCVRNTPD